MKIKEHLKTNSKPLIFKNLNPNRNCKEFCDNDCFEIVDATSCSYRLKLKEAIHITREKLSMNKQIKCVRVSITLS